MRSFLIAFIGTTSLAACASKTYPASYTATMANSQGLALLGFGVGAVLTYRFSASFVEQSESGTRNESWTCLVTDHVASARERVANGIRWTVVEIHRSVDSEGGGPQHDEHQTPHPGRFFFIFGGVATAHDLADHATTHQGLAVFRQDDHLNVEMLDEAELVYVLPLRAGSLWHFEPEARREARLGRHITTMSRKIEQHLSAVRTASGVFQNCWLIDTWASANTNDSSWVCEGVGEVRREVDSFAGSLRSKSEWVLIHRTHP